MISSVWIFLDVPLSPAFPHPGQVVQPSLAWPRQCLFFSRPWRRASSPGRVLVWFSFPRHRPGCLDHFQMAQDQGQRSDRWVYAKLFQPPHLGLTSHCPLSSPSPSSEWLFTPGAQPVYSGSCLPWPRFTGSATLPFACWALLDLEYWNQQGPQPQKSNLLILQMGKLRLKEGERQA